MADHVKRVTLADLDASEYDNIYQALDHRAIAAEAALSLEKALQPVRMDAFRDKVWEVVAEMFEYAGYEAGGYTINEYVDKIIGAY